MVNTFGRVLTIGRDNPVIEFFAAVSVNGAIVTKYRVDAAMFDRVTGQLAIFSIFVGAFFALDAIVTDRPLVETSAVGMLAINK
jgi:hypothetical protein